MRNRDRISIYLSLAAIVFLAPACDKVKSPTEPVAAVAPTQGPTSTPTPRATPTPTAIPRPASLSGKVTKYSGPIVGTKVECQGKSTTTSSDGTYAFTDLVSGPTLIRAYSPTEYEDRTVSLAPGTNVADFFFYE